ncbi:RagB/SusD family nutrient uptake outer membrane protein [Haoranjiania flava]|uniref:RagB/SusD family nutrient uptake outer membrane protein n=1 Tax=Haoranjiania flava TaxID=1856322 RepID=A0AAE3LN00_9BACT|nr:RagB/SusD family nutrient uptake outer membrane protein [Haoranjiania flava]MCU7694436.1 RagB/SusD family nutrient uptake outer membrane protein [Haoranjiania flava]
MKNKCLSVLLLTGMFLGSCADKLDLYPHSSMSPDAITEKDLPALRIGMYNDMQNDPGVHAFILFDILGGNLHTASGSPLDLINSQLSPLAGVVSNGWNGYYGALYQVNNVISICENQAPNSVRNTALGEAYYFRALIYYNLLTRWGGVPIYRKNSLEKLSRNSKEEVWAFIEENLDAAEELLGESSSYYYVSKDAVEALKARVFLYQDKKPEAAAIAEKLITSNKYKLDSFEKIFRKQANSEIIFAFENRTEESSINISDLFYSYAHPNKGQGVYRVSQQMVDAYSGTDKRRDITITNIAGTYCINKYPSGQTGRDPVIISRISELYLISAEAQGRIKGIDRLNELRRYRGLTDISVTSDEQYQEAMLNERNLELFGENFRYYDLVRTNTAVEKLGILNYQTVLPIPGRELQYNTNLEPNPGY